MSENNFGLNGRRRQEGFAPPVRRRTRSRLGAPAVLSERDERLRDYRAMPSVRRQRTATLARFAA